MTNKASGFDGIPPETVQILKDDAVRVLQSICQQNWKTELWPQDWERSVFIPILKKGNAKECPNYCTSHTSKLMLKITQARIQQYVSWKLPYVQAEFRKGNGKWNQRSNCWQLLDNRKRKKKIQKLSTSAFLTFLKTFTVWITTNYGKFWKRWKYQTFLPASWETCM